jgi:predicted RNase H-like nuclease (RuvC/YqgF family)
MAHLQNLIKTLKQNGKTDQEIVAVVEAITQAALIKATNALLQFAKNTPEATELEKITDEAEGQKKLAELYQKTTNQTFEQLASEKLEEMAKEYLDKSP